MDSAELKIDLESIGVTGVQIGGDEVKLPVVTNVVEGNVGNVVSVHCVHVVHGAPHASQHGDRTATAVEKDRVRVGDGVAVGIAGFELHRNGSLALLQEYTAAVIADWR